MFKINYINKIKTIRDYYNINSSIKDEIGEVDSFDNYNIVNLG